MRFCPHVGATSFRSSFTCSADRGTDRSDVLTSPMAIGVRSPSSSAKNPKARVASSTSVSRDSTLNSSSPTDPVISLMSVSVSAITSSSDLTAGASPPPPLSA